MTVLETLANKRDLILLAEIGVLIHDIGKLSEEFVGTKGTNAPADGRWSEDVHCEVVQAHATCVVPAVLTPYLLANAEVNINLARQGVAQAVGEAVQAAFIRTEPGLSRLLADLVGRRLSGAVNTKSIKDRLSLLYRRDQKGQVQSTLVADLESRFGKGSQKARAYATQLEVAWPLIEPTINDQIEWLNTLLAHENRLRRESLVQRDFLPLQCKQTLITLLPHWSEIVQLKDFIELHHGRHWDIPYLLQLLRAKGQEEDDESKEGGDIPEGCDGLDSFIDKGQLPKKGAEQEFAKTCIATAFGHEPDGLHIVTSKLKQVRHEYADILTLILQRIVSERAPLNDDQALPKEFWQEVLYYGWQTTDGCKIKGLRGLTENVFRKALGETRRAANDVTLWDHCYSVASLYKAALVKVLIEGKRTEPKEIGWRFLRVGVDGLDFFAQAHHVTDMLGRRQALMDALNRVRDTLEVEYPLGNEVYRDENGSVFVMPGLTDETAHKQLDREVREIVLSIFRQMGAGGELLPDLVWNDDDRQPVRNKMVTAFGQLVTKPVTTRSDVQAVGDCWHEVQATGKEVCTVCGQRPVGYVEPGLAGWVTPQKAEDRHVCGVCLDRRGRRAHNWARNKPDEGETIGSFERTIWTDEVADDNGRFALVVGRFGLDGWLDGKLVSTLLVNPTDSKNPSPARIRRCWETTRQFWQDVQQQTLPEKVEQRLRLGIRPANVPAINHPERGLGRWHTYEADIKGRRLGLCWDPNDEMTTDRNLFWTTDNLCYLGRQLGIKEEALQSDDSLQAAFLPHSNGQTLTLYEPGGYLGQERRANADAESCLVAEKKYFQPFIPLLAEPATFMALVPASVALDIVRAVKEKYDTEMARVRDRLPLHLGLVFAPRHTPLAAVLEAGQAMLRIPTRWEEWQVEAAGRKATFNQHGRRFEWNYPVEMGDKKAKDTWYPHLLVVDPTTKGTLDKSDFRLVDDLAGDVFIRPSRFDFTFLDTTARRFEMHYGDDGRRTRRTRPFLLDDLDRLEVLWEQLRSLKTSQRHQVIATIEATREAWFGTDRKGESLTDGVFRQFVRDTLAGAAWPEQHRWNKMDKTLRKRLEDAGVSGELADLAELHMHILKE